MANEAGHFEEADKELCSTCDHPRGEHNIIPGSGVCTHWDALMYCTCKSFVEPVATIAAGGEALAKEVQALMDELAERHCDICGHLMGHHDLFGRCNECGCGLG